MRHTKRGTCHTHGYPGTRTRRVPGFSAKAAGFKSNPKPSRVVAAEYIGFDHPGHTSKQKRTRRAPFRGYVIVDYSSSSSQSFCEYQYKIPRHVDSFNRRAFRGSGQTSPAKKMRCVDLTRPDPRDFESLLAPPDPTREIKKTVDPTRLDP